MLTLLAAPTDVVQPKSAPCVSELSFVTFTSRELGADKATVGKLAAES